MHDARAIAELILKGFRRHFRLFQQITHQAGEHFQNANWRGYQQDSADRIHYYDDRVTETIEQLRQIGHRGTPDTELWQEIKGCYQQALLFHPQAELAETFYNSVFCRLFHRQYFHNQLIFVESTVSKERLPVPMASVYDSYFPAETGMRAAIRQILRRTLPTLQFSNLDRDIRYVLKSYAEQASHDLHPIHLLRLDILKSVFYRNKAAYLVGRIVTPDGQEPFILSILHDPKRGIYIDALLTEPTDMSLIFGFSRAYFMVDVPVPSALVHFLKELLPHRTLAELYSAVGLHKQGKTEYYRELLCHLEQSQDQFVAAPGIRGLVMMVFTLPSFPYVFKVIRDTFAESKPFGRDTVKARYHLVKSHDRVGRMADTMEYSDVALPINRFSKELLDELQASIADSMYRDGDQLVIRHLYIERRMTPLNIALEQADDTEKQRLMQDYGQALKDMVAANIFPGDMLLKNFGVTRHGRVVFYDYDEVQYLLDMNFRAIPTPDNWDDMLSAEPWYPIHPGDVFPEQIATFVTSQPQLRDLLSQSHPELLDYQYWQQKQQSIRQGQVEDVFPYSQQQRFCLRYGQ